MSLGSLSRFIHRVTRNNRLFSRMSNKIFGVNFFSLVHSNARQTPHSHTFDTIFSISTSVSISWCTWLLVVLSATVVVAVAAAAAAAVGVMLLLAAAMGVAGLPVPGADGLENAESRLEVGGVLGVPGVTESSRGELGERRGSARSSRPSGVGNLFSSSRSSL